MRENILFCFTEDKRSLFKRVCFRQKVFDFSKRPLLNGAKHCLPKDRGKVKNAFQRFLFGFLISDYHNDLNKCPGCLSNIFIFYLGAYLRSALKRSGHLFIFS